jgi:hypothetical protein
LKWLLVERATLAGDVARILEQEVSVDRELSRVQEHLARLTLESDRLQRLKVQLPQILDEKRAQMAALDTSIRLASSDRVSPAVAGTVRAYAGRYGKRGDLKAFIISELKKEAPGAVATSTIVLGAILHFGLTFATAREQKAFRKNTITPQLTQLREQGLVEALHTRNRGPAEGSWRWKASYPTLAELADQVRGDTSLPDAREPKDS